MEATTKAPVISHMSVNDHIKLMIKFTRELGLKMQPIIYLTDEQILHLMRDEDKFAQLKALVMAGNILRGVLETSTGKASNVSGA